MHDPALISLLDREGSTNDDSPSPPDALLKDQLHQLSVNKIHNSWSSGQFLFNRKGKVIRNYDQDRGWRTHNDEVDHKPFVCSPVATTALSRWLGVCPEGGTVMWSNACFGT